MHKAIIAPIVISIILASLLAIEVSNDGGQALTQLFARPEAAQNNNNNLSPSSNQQNSGSSSSINDKTAETARTSSAVSPLKVINSNTTVIDNNSNDTANASALLNAQTIVLNQIFNNVKDSVVQITSKVNTVVPNIIINGNPLQSQSTRLGSGFVQDAAKGLIITNNHVIAGSRTVDVTFADGNTYSAKVIGADSFSDLAVLQITDNFSKEHLVSLQLANSSQLKVGQQIVAIGNPFGLSDTMTSGIISQVGRLLPNQEMGFSIPDVIQTDAALNPGNSGGPMLDLQGHVIGVNSAISSQTGDFAGIGFAIPSNTVARVVPYLIRDGNYDHPWLGIAGGNLTPDLAQQLGLPRDFTGVVVASVTPGSPADKAGIMGRIQDRNNAAAGDIITSIDGHNIKRMEDIISYIEVQRSVGDKILVTVYHNGQPHDLTVTLQARPAPTSQ
jgi:S1-C subfamily serine protease